MIAADGPGRTGQEGTRTDGRVETLDQSDGVSGWALDLDAPTTMLTIELWAGDELIDTTLTGLARQDVCDALQLDGMPGYRFDSSVHDRIRAVALRGLHGDLVVRIAGEDASLPSLTDRRTLASVRAESTPPLPTTTDTLMKRLSSLARDAAQHLGDSPNLHPRPGRGIGFVETIAMDDSGLIWVTGWIRDDLLRDRPIVIVDTDPHAAGFAYELVDRNDLPPGGRAFAGVLRTDWRASTALPAYFFLADGSGDYLESLIPTPICAQQDIAPVIRALLAEATGGYRDVLRRLFQTIQSWEVSASTESRDLLQIDEVAVLPGFGALITGWMLSPSKASAGFILRAGDRFLVADNRSVSRFARTDLSHFYGNVDLALARAGFTAVFRGNLDGAPLNRMVVKGRWTDGTDTNAAIAPESVRMLGVTAPIERALNFYPAIEAEPFFHDFARHAVTAVQRRASMIDVFEAEPVTAALVLALPDNTSDLFLMIDDALRNAGTLPADWGIVLVGCPDGVRALIVSLFADLKRATGRRCSLLFTASPNTTNHALLAVLDTVGLDQFAFITSGAFLTEAGWAALNEPAGQMTLLEIRDPAAHQSTAGSVGFDAFACDAATWRRIAATAGPRIGGVALEAAGSVCAKPHRVIDDAAFALDARRSSALVAQINLVGQNPHG